MSTSTGRGATVAQAPHLFVSIDSGPQNLLHHDIVSGYGFAASSTATARHHHNYDCENAQTERKAINREHLRVFLFLYIRIL
jgi:hypothetical protein